MCQYTVSFLLICSQGLPKEWEALLSSSGIRKEEVVQNHQAVLDVLEFVDKQEKKTTNPTKAPPENIEISLDELVNKTGDPEVLYTNYDKCGEGFVRFSCRSPSTSSHLLVVLLAKYF